MVRADQKPVAAPSYASTSARTSTARSCAIDSVGERIVVQRVVEIEEDGVDLLHQKLTRNERSP